MGKERVKMLVLDCDGVLTDGSLPYLCDADRLIDGKIFNVQDGAALVRWREAGGKVAVISGRDSPALKRRCDELKIDFLAQGVTDKTVSLAEAFSTFSIEPREVCYVGDDVPDIVAMERVGCPVAVRNARPSVKRAALHVTRCSGGAGAVAEVIEWLLVGRERVDEEPAADRKAANAG